MRYQLIIVCVLLSINVVSMEKFPTKLSKETQKNIAVHSTPLVFGLSLLVYSVILSQVEPSTLLLFVPGIGLCILGGILIHMANLNSPEYALRQTAKEIIATEKNTLIKIIEKYEYEKLNKELIIVDTSQANISREEVIDRLQKIHTTFNFAETNLQWGTKQPLPIEVKKWCSQELPKVIDKKRKIARVLSLINNDFQKESKIGGEKVET